MSLMLPTTVNQTLSPIDDFLNNALSIPLVRTFVYVLLLCIFVGLFALPFKIYKARKEKRKKEAQRQQYQAFKRAEAERNKEKDD